MILFTLIFFLPLSTKCSDSGSQATALVLRRRSRGNAAVIGSKMELASGAEEGSRVALPRD